MVTLAFVHTLLDRVSDHYRDQIGDNPKTLSNKGFEVVTTKISLT